VKDVTQNVSFEHVVDPVGAAPKYVAMEQVARQYRIDGPVGFMLQSQQR
jgi:hypothetical protein